MLNDEFEVWMVCLFAISTIVYTKCKCTWQLLYAFDRKKGFLFIHKFELQSNLSWYSHAWLTIQIMSGVWGRKNVIVNCQVEQMSALGGALSMWFTQKQVHVFSVLNFIVKHDYQLWLTPQKCCLCLFCLKRETNIDCWLQGADLTVRFILCGLLLCVLSNTCQLQVLPALTSSSFPSLSQFLSHTLMDITSPHTKVLTVQTVFNVYYVPFNCLVDWRWTKY